MKHLRVALIDVYGVHCVTNYYSSKQRPEDLVTVHKGSLVFVISKYDHKFTKVLCSSGVVLVVSAVLDRNTTEC
jgi:hypothetical protein